MTDVSVEERIKQLIKNHIIPNLATHGGYIEFKSYEDKKLSLELQGACVGCAGIFLTIGKGIIPMIEKHIPEVEKISIVEGDTSKIAPYYTSKDQIPEQERIFK